MKYTKVIETKMDLGRQLRERGYTIRHFAWRIGIHYTYLSRIIKGKSIPTFEIYQRIIRAIQSK